MTNYIPADWIGPMSSLAGPATALIIVIALVDGVLRGWALWRAARMTKLTWFIGLVIINSAGILPVIFLMMTNKEYTEKGLKRKKS